MTIAEAKALGTRLAKESREQLHNARVGTPPHRPLGSSASDKLGRKSSSEEIEGIGHRHPELRKAKPKIVEAFRKAYVSTGVAENKKYITEFEEGPITDLAKHIKMLRREGFLDDAEDL